MIYNMNDFEFNQPEFLLCEIAIKDSSLLCEHIQNDQRLWIYHLSSASLIEFVYMNDLGSYNFSEKHKEFLFLNNRYTGFFVQNNCKINKENEDSVLDLAWEYLEKFLAWQEEIYNRANPLRLYELRGKNNFDIN